MDLFAFPSQIASSSLNKLSFKAAKAVLEDGQDIDSRNGNAKELQDVSLFLTNPRARHLYLEGRKNNIFATIAETFWVFSGEDKINPYLSFFLPRAKNYSDDGETWRGNYSQRVYNHKQIENILDMFKEDSINTRRAVMTVWQPELDTVASIKRVYGLDKTVDVPCSQHLNFWVRNNKLNLKFLMRSNDWCWGFSNINVFEFTFFQELMANMIDINSNLGTPLDLGYYHHNATSFHVYDFTLTQAEAVIQASQGFRIESHSIKKMKLFDMEKFSDSSDLVNTVKDFFVELVDFLTFHVETIGNDLVFRHSLRNLEEIFEYRYIPVKDNQLFDYAAVVLAYIFAKKGNQQVNLDVSKFSTDFKNAIKLSNFRKFELTE